MLEGLLVRQGPGRAGLDALATEGAVGVTEQTIEFGRDPGVEAAVHDADGVVALLFGTDPDASVAGDALVIVAQDEGVVVVVAALSGLSALEASAVGVISLHEGLEFLRRIACEFIHVHLAILGYHELHEGAAVPLDGLGCRADLHSCSGPGRAGGNRVTRTLKFHDA